MDTLSFHHLISAGLGRWNFQMIILYDIWLDVVICADIIFGLLGYWNRFCFDQLVFLILSHLSKILFVLLYFRSCAFGRTILNDFLRSKGKIAALEWNREFFTWYFFGIIAHSGVGRALGGGALAGDSLQRPSRFLKLRPLWPGRLVFNNYFDLLKLHRILNLYCVIQFGCLRHHDLMKVHQIFVFVQI